MIKLIFITTLAIFLTQVGLPERVMYLEGVWKIDGKEVYEQWELSSDASMKGKSYKVQNGRSAIMETLQIVQDDNGIRYEATVPGQNDGKTIPFVLNERVNDTLSFENPDHDFPNKIQYIPQSADKVFVRVIGNDGQGFDYYMSRSE